MGTASLGQCGVSLRDIAYIRSTVAPCRLSFRENQLLSGRFRCAAVVERLMDAGRRRMPRLIYRARPSIIQCARLAALCNGIRLSFSVIAREMASDSARGHGPGIKWHRSPRKTRKRPRESRAH